MVGYFYSIQNKLLQFVPHEILVPNEKFDRNDEENYQNWKWQYENGQEDYQFA